MMTPIVKLGELGRGHGGRIISIGGQVAGAIDAAGEGQDDLAQRLMEMGLLEGCDVQVVHEAPFGGDPIAIRVRGALVALRRSEANQIVVDTGKKGA
ncbi:MAG: ferrous iron transport protein A [Oligoflexia bacterium]|nr:ferrous iron transport protein A [Oligoflexia bacterium]